MPAHESEFKWDNDENIALFNDRPFALASKSVPSEQYDYFDYEDPDSTEFNGFDKVYNTISREIGIALIVFSELETALEYNLHELISNRSHQVGRIITRGMEYAQKVNLYIDYLRSSYNGDESEEYKKDIGTLKSHLLRAGEIRNIIAHAKWSSIKSDGYVLSKVDTITIGNPPDYKYYKLNKTALDEARSYISWVANLPYYIDEKYTHNFR